MLSYDYEYVCVQILAFLLHILFEHFVISLICNWSFAEEVEIWKRGGAESYTFHDSTNV